MLNFLSISLTKKSLKSVKIG